MDVEQSKKLILKFGKEFLKRVSHVLVAIFHSWLVALSLEAHKAEILAANQLDLDQATIEYQFILFVGDCNRGLSGQLLKRLKLTEQKIDSLVDGIRCIAKQAEPLGQVDTRIYLDVRVYRSFQEQSYQKTLFWIKFLVQSEYY